MSLLIVYLLLLIMAIANPRSKKISVLIAFFMIFVYAIPWHEGDLEVYEWVYNDLFTGQFYSAYEPGFVASMWLCKTIGLTFIGFRIALGSFIVWNIYRIIRRQTDYCALTIALYCIFPFFMFASVLRSGISSVFVLLAIEQLISRESNKKKYLFYILLGTLFHYSSLLFIPFVFFTGEVRKSRILAVFIGMCALTFLISYTDVIYSIASHFTQRQKILIWLTRNDATANMTGMIAIAVLLISIYLLNKYNANTGNQLFIYEIQANTSRWNQFRVSYQMSLYMLFLFPMLVLASPIMRIPYEAFLLFILSSVNAVQERKTEYMCIEQNGAIILPMELCIICVALMWKFYAQLPYLKSGAHLFSEFLDARLIGLLN